jgi:cobaltochelatase CobT
MNTELATTSYNQSLAKDIGMGAVRSALMRLLRSQDLVGWSSREESGRLDRRSFKRMAAGEESLFSRRQYKEAEKSAVSIMVDCSGSMSGTGIEPAQDVSIHLGQLLDKARVSFACHGFRSTSTMDASVTGRRIHDHPV